MVVAVVPISVGPATVDVLAGYLAPSLPQVVFRPIRLWIRCWLLAVGGMRRIDLNVVVVNYPIRVHKILSSTETNAMTRTSMYLAIAFVSGCLVTATSISGCSKAADRTLTIYQFQSVNTYSGPFRVDTSGLPEGAVATKSETGSPGDPLTRIELNSNFAVEVVLRLADKD